MKKIILLLTMVLWLVPSAFGEENEIDYFSVLNSIEDPNVQPSQVSGTIQEITLEGRAAIISGLMYFFGPATLATPVEVRMLGVEYGAFELLRVGMAVEVQYLQAPEYRIGRSVVQVESAKEH